MSSETTPNDRLGSFAFSGHPPGVQAQPPGAQQGLGGVDHVPGPGVQVLHARAQPFPSGVGGPAEGSLHGLGSGHEDDLLQVDSLFFVVFIG